MMEILNIIFNFFFTSRETGNFFSLFVSIKVPSKSKPKNFSKINFLSFFQPIIFSQGLIFLESFQEKKISQKIFTLIFLPKIYKLAIFDQNNPKGAFISCGFSCESSIGGPAK